MTAAILLAAVQSTRMRRPKALLSWGNATLIEYQVRELAGEVSGGAGRVWDTSACSVTLRACLTNREGSL